MEKNELPQEPNPLPNTDFLMKVFSGAESRRIIHGCKEREALDELYRELTRMLAETSTEDMGTLASKLSILQAYQEGMTQAEAVQELLGQQILPSKLKYSQMEQGLAFELRRYYKAEANGQNAPVLSKLSQTALTVAPRMLRVGTPLYVPWLKELEHMPDVPLEDVVTEFVASYSGVSDYLEFLKDPQIMGLSALLIGHLTSEQELSLDAGEAKRLGVTLRLARETYKKVVITRTSANFQHKQEQLVMRILLGAPDGANVHPKARYSEVRSNGPIQLPTASEADGHIQSAFLEMAAFRRYDVKQRTAVRLPRGNG